MSDELLPYYNRELAFFRKMGAQFAEANPKIAARLKMGPEIAEDPHVGRMIEAFAYLNARTRHKIEDDFPEITESLLSVLYPHFLAPIPSMAIIEFQPDPTQADLNGYLIQKDSAVETEPIDGEPCRFRTAFPVKLWPFAVKEASIKGHPFTAPSTRHSGEAESALRLVLECFSPEASFQQFKMDRLRFFIQGQPPFNYDLYEVLFNNVLGVVAANGADDPEPVDLGAGCILPVGFDRDQGMLEYSARSFVGYRLLTEYFAFPEKFLFFDVQFRPGALARIGRRLELFFYINKGAGDLERNVDAQTLRPGCTPMVNLFKQQAEPIRLTHADFEYRVVPDARRPMAHEVYSVERVTATSPDGQKAEFRPFYSLRHSGGAGAGRTYWHASRRPAAEKAGQVDHGTEVFLSLVDLDFQPSFPTDWTVVVETTCLNRDLPFRLPFGGGQPRLQLTKGAPLAGIRCLTRPNRTWRPAMRHSLQWRLISHLSLNHISLVDYDEGADALREILTLYNFSNTAETRNKIDGLRSIRAQRVVGRVGGAVSAGMCRGMELTLNFDEEKFTGGGVFLFAAVLERFMGLYSSINSFTQTIATTNQRDGVMHRWPPRAGEQVLL